MRKIKGIFSGLALAALALPVQAQQPELDPNLFQSSGMVSLETAKKEMKRVYGESRQTRTLHCGCFFDQQNEVHTSACDQVRERPRHRSAKKILQWVHAMPRSVFADSMSCWLQDVCRRRDGTAFRGSRCCAAISPKFKSMEADMHNLIPSVAMDETPGEMLPQSRLFGGMAEYQFCAAGGTLPADPRPGSRGDLARAYFYMAYQYRVRIPDSLEDRLRQWHLKDPPDPQEETRNSLIEIVQGNRNPFIDHPELVERVRNF